MDFDSYTAGYYDRLLGLATTLGGPQDAEDLVQAALVKALKSWPRIARMENVHAYVRRIVTNEFLSGKRHLRRTPSAHLTLESVTQPDLANAVADRAALNASVSSLPPKQRAAIVLRYYEDLSDADIAATLGCRTSTVRSNITRALAALRVSSELDPAAVDRSADVYGE